MKIFTGFIVGLLLFVTVGTAVGKEGGSVIEKGRQVAFEYTLTVDGKVVDSSQGHEPFHYTHGQGTIIPGLSKQMEGLRVGDEKSIVVPAKDAYGPVDPNAFQEIPKSRLPQGIDLHPGTQLQASSPDGRAILVTVSQLKGDNVVLNFNHPLAGKELHFQVKIVSIQ